MTYHSDFCRFLNHIEHSAAADTADESCIPARFPPTPKMLEAGCLAGAECPFMAEEIYAAMLMTGMSEAGHFAASKHGET